MIRWSSISREPYSQGFQRGVELSTHDLNFLEPPSSNKEGPDRLLSLESVPSGGGTFVQPSETLCTHICGLQVAVAVGLEGDPLGRNILGLLALVPVIVMVAEVIGTVEVMAVVPSVATVGTSPESPNVIT